MKYLLFALHFVSLAFASPVPAVQKSVNHNNPGITSDGWIQAVCKTKHDSGVVPWSKPVISWAKKSQVSPRDYLKPSSRAFGKDVAIWQRDFFGTGSVKKYRNSFLTKPIRENAPTVVSIFYPDPKQTRRPIDHYLERIKRLADAGEQTIIYVPKEISTKIRDMREDKTHWIVVDEFSSVFDFPNVKEQMAYIQKQKPLFDAMNGESQAWKLQRFYDNPFLSSVYHAKYYAVYDAIMRNPFGSTTWMYVDAGAYDKENNNWPGSLINTKGYLDPEKFARAIEISGQSGIVMPEYIQNSVFGKADFNNDCWTNPRHLWRCHHFLANTWIGSTLGMLEFSVKYMQTVDDMNANGMYSGREEFNIPFVAARYPNTVFSIPCTDVQTGKTGLRCNNWYSVKAEFSSWSGKNDVSAIDDPIDTLFCPASSGYKPRKPNLAHGKAV